MRAPSLLFLRIAFVLSGIGVALAAEKPNIVLILADDAGTGDFSPYGCKYGETPNIARLAREGMRFTNAYSGNAVCAPSRCSLMTGLDPGHAAVRANRQSSVDGHQSLPAGTRTVAAILHDAGYATGGFGKWSLGNIGEDSVPEKMGFDEFFGYYDQTRAHDYFPESLVRNSEIVPFPQSGKKSWPEYSATRIADETIGFIERNKDKPFFCYAAWTPPHGDYVIPDNAPYGGKPWSEIERNYAAMVALVDKDLGRVMAKLKELGLDERTIVIFSSDNGANEEFIRELGSTGGLRGYKRLLYEGGIRAPFIVRWPGRIRAGSSSGLLTSFIDFLPTAAELAGAPAPQATDGLSILPTLLGLARENRHESLYFEIYEPFFQQAVRLADWKGYRTGTDDALELYDLKSDPAEARDVAADHPDVVRKIETIMATRHTPSPHYKAVPHGGNGKSGKERKSGATLGGLLDDRR